jgi:hypothetical protein
VSTEDKPERVILITGGADNGAEIARMLAGKVGAEQYEVLTRSEAGERGLLYHDQGELSPEDRRRVYMTNAAPAIRPRPNTERDAWNAAVDARKAAKRGRKAAA